MGRLLTVRAHSVGHSYVVHGSRRSNTSYAERVTMNLARALAVIEGVLPTPEVDRNVERRSSKSLLVEGLCDRALEDRYPYVWLDADLEARQGERVASSAAVSAVGVKGDTGEGEVLGLDVGTSEKSALQSAFLARWMPAVCAGLGRSPATLVGA